MVENASSNTLDDSCPATAHHAFQATVSTYSEQELSQDSHQDIPVRPQTAPASTSTFKLPSLDLQATKQRAASFLHSLNAHISTSFSTLSTRMPRRFNTAPVSSHTTITKEIHSVDEEQEAWLLTYAETDLDRMRLALLQARKCPFVKTAYNVGAALFFPPTPSSMQHAEITTQVDHENTLKEQDRPSPATITAEVSYSTHVGHLQLLSLGYSRQLPGNTHAEECCFLHLDDLSLARGGWLYTTMEPCSLRLSGKTSCTKRILDAGIARVIVGVREPDVFVDECTGIEDLQQAGVDVVVMDGLEYACLAPNLHLLEEDSIDRVKQRMKKKKPEQNDACRVKEDRPISVRYCPEGYDPVLSS